MPRKPKEEVVKSETISEPIKEEKPVGIFTVNGKEAGGFEAFAPGEYEVIISEAKATESANGNPMVKVTLTVRNDVDQANQKRKIFENYVQTPAAMFKFQQVAKALGWEDGKQINSLDEFANEILYQAVRVKTNIRTSSGYEPSTNVIAYKPSEFAYDGAGGQVNDPFSTDGAPIDISDDDLPF